VIALTLPTACKWIRCHAILLMLLAHAVCTGPCAMRAHATDLGNRESPIDHESHGDHELKGVVHGKPLRIATTARVAGAIDSIQWNGMEMIDSFDHGRQLQSAASFDCGDDGPFWAERFNPTEAGSRSDGTGNTSTSALIEFEGTSSWLRSRTQLAFWTPPGELTFGRPALNQSSLSNHWLTKRIQIGCDTSPDAIQFDVEFEMPADESHRLAQFEVLTGYMPPIFERFWRWDATLSEFVELSDGPGEQPDPVAFSTRDREYTMGVWMKKAAGYEPIGYGRFRFEQEQVVKWNCVTRLRSPDRITKLRHSFRVYVVTGTLNDIANTFRSFADHETP
jgi:hypothetical protein